MPEWLTGIEEVHAADNGVASSVDIKDDGAVVDAEDHCFSIKKLTIIKSTFPGGGAGMPGVGWGRSSVDIRRD